MKNTKKLLSFLCLFMLVVTFSFSTFAANDVTGTTTLELVDDTKCTISIDDFLDFEKKITEFNEENRSATLSLTVTNTKVSESTTKPVEIFLVIDNSASMRENKVGEVTREQLVIDSANKLVDKLFEANTQAKVGVVSFSSLDNMKGETEGTINDGKLLSELSNSKTDVKNIISSIPTTNAGPRTNIEAGITIASQNYSSNENTNRYIVLLTDGVPNNDINGTFATYSGTVATRTKAKLQSIEQSGINIIGAMIGLDGERTEQQSGKTYRALAEEIFGTVQNPTISSYYYVTDADIETTIVDKVYSKIIIKEDNTLKDIIIKDYFPQEIIDNFNFAHVTAPNIGGVTQEVDSANNSITWTIPELKEGETATLSYKLTLKENYNKEIIDKVMPTNTKVDITGKDTDGKNYEKSSNDSPKVKVLYIEPVAPKDNTITNTVIPQAGEDNSIAFVVIVGIIAIISISRFVYLKKKMNM